MRRHLLLISLIAKKYKERVLASTGLLIVSAISTFLSDSGFVETNTGYLVYQLLVYGPSFVVLVLILFSFGQVIVERQRRTGLYQDSLFLDCFYSSERKYWLQTRHSLRNVGKTPVSEFGGIKDGYLEYPSKFEVSGSIENNSKGRLFKLNPSADLFEKKFDICNGQESFYSFESHAHFEPPVLPGESVNVAVVTYAEGVEERVFTEQGTAFSWRLFYETSFLSICVHAPCGYTIELLASSITSETGEQIKEVANRFQFPKFLREKSLMVWELHFPRPHQRFGMRFRFVKI